MRRMIVVLTTVTIVAGFVLALASSVFTERIEANREAAFRRSLSEVFDSVDSPEFELLAPASIPVYRVMVSGGRTRGYAARIVTAGYGGDITMLVGVGTDLESITGLAIVEDVETPGLGARIEEEQFRLQFEGLDVDRPIVYVKNRDADFSKNQIEAISGATISTDAVVSGINASLDEAVAEMRKRVRGDESESGSAK